MATQDCTIPPAVPSATPDTYQLSPEVAAKLRMPERTDLSDDEQREVAQLAMLLDAYHRTGKGAMK
jgi:hypothetical protein